MNVRSKHQAVVQTDVPTKSAMAAQRPGGKKRRRGKRAKRTKAGY